MLLVASMLVPAFVGIVGLVIYLASANNKVSEIGRLSFFAGLFWLVYLFAHAAIAF